MPLALKLIAASACPSSARAQFRFQSRRIPCALGRTRRDARERAGTTTTTRSYRTESGHNKLLGFEQTTHSASTSVTHQYDAAGNLQSDGLHHYHYDSQGRLQSSQTGQGADAPTTRYAHNALGQRVFKTEPLYAAASGKDGALDEEEDPETPGLLQTLRDFFTQLWNPAKSEAEHLGWAYVYDEEGSLLGEYGMGGSQSAGQSQYLYLPTAQGPIPIAADIDSRLYAIHTDHLGTPRRLTQADGQAAWQWAYSAYGDEAPTLGAKRFTNETTNPTTGSTNIAPVRFNLRYPGQYFDAESGLHYNYFRSYDPRTGRYTQGDPIGLAGGWNRFAYVEGDPLNAVDPVGLWASQMGAYVHQRAGFQVFGAEITQEQLAIVAQGHEWADSPSHQTAAFTFMHAMRNGNQSADQACLETNRFIKNFARDALASKSRGNMADALFSFAIALHAMQDSTSPSHRGFQVWTGHETRGQVAKHVAAEMQNQGLGTDLDRITRQAWNAFKSGNLDGFKVECQCR